MTIKDCFCCRDCGVAAQPLNTVDAEKSCTHPNGYIKSVRICGLCGEQLYGYKDGINNKLIQPTKKSG